MFLHLGGGVSVRLSEILYIEAVAKGKASDANRRFWAHCQKERDVRDLSAGKPRSRILTDTSIYLSGISALTLKKRSDLFLFRDD